MFSRLWAILTNKKKLKVLGWYAGGVIAVLGAFASLLAIIGFFLDHGDSPPVSSARTNVAVSSRPLTGGNENPAPQGQGCDTSMTITIKTPLDGGTISADSDSPEIRGMATPSETCRYVYVFVRDTGSDHWIVTERTETSPNGIWFGKLDLGHVNRGNRANVLAILIDRPIYKLNTSFDLPPAEGRHSQQIRVLKE